MKYFLCLFVIALASQASAQLHCFVCENCQTIPDNLVAQQCSTLVSTTLPPAVTTTLTPPILPTTTLDPELTPLPTSPPNVITTTTIPNTNPTNPAPPSLTTATSPPVVTPSTPPATLPTNPPALVPTNAPIIVLPDLTNPIPNPSSNPIPTPEDPFNPELTPLPNVVRNRRNVEVVAASQFSCFTLQTQFNATTVITNRGCVRTGGDTAQTCRSANANIVEDSCSLCHDNECNSSTSLIASLSLITAALLFAIKLY